MRGHWKLLGGRGVSKAKILEANYEAKLEFLGGRGVQNKNLPWGEYKYFLNLHIIELLGLLNNNWEMYKALSFISYFSSNFSCALNNSCMFKMLLNNAWNKFP